MDEKERAFREGFKKEAQHGIGKGFLDALEMIGRKGREVAGIRRSISRKAGRPLRKFLGKPDDKFRRMAKSYESFQGYPDIGFSGNPIDEWADIMARKEDLRYGDALLGGAATGGAYGGIFGLGSALSPE